MSSPGRDSRETDADRPAIDADAERAGDDAERAAEVAEREFARREIVGTIASLAASVIVAGGCVAYYAYAKGEAGLYASGAGAVAVIVGAAIASVLPFFVDRPLRPLVRSFGGLLLKAGLPLGVVFWARMNRQEWLDEGLLVTVIASYLAGWIVEAIWRMGLRNALIRRHEQNQARRGSKTVPSVF